ncbi:gamma-glutamylcyclotransferase family protein [Cellulosilyticum lentocellum]|uniref:gamma-glutamylcyclotransferase family protein n=1 Tax=Cellulosilyticum lentocellum TaxID=29360 RepID=UPI0009FF1338
MNGETCVLSNAKHLKSIDLLEGYTGNSKKDLYIREKGPVLLSTGEEELCWVYLYINEKHVRNNGKYIAHRDWKKIYVS